MDTVRALTEAEAANVALGHLGQPTIANLSDNNIRARTARLFFGNVRDAMLREKWWSFAKGWVSPAADANQSLGPLKARYFMPEDCLRVRYIDDGHGNQFDELTGAWDIEAGRITLAGAAVDVTVVVTNVSNPLIAYTKRIVEVRLWDAVFLEAFEFELASYMARKLARSRGMSADMHALAQQRALTAAGIDSKESSRKTIGRSPSWVTARMGFREWPR